MVKLSEIASLGARSIEVEIADDTFLALTVLPNVMTLNLEKEMQTAQATGDTGKLAEVFFKVVQKWDLVDDNGIMLPRNEETIGQLGIAMVALIMEKIMEIVVPKEPTPISSKGGSRTQK